METSIILKNTDEKGLFNFYFTLIHPQTTIKKKFFLIKKEYATKARLSAIVLNKKGEIIDHLYSPEFEKNKLITYGLPPGQLLSRDNALSYLSQKIIDPETDLKLEKQTISISFNHLTEAASQIIFFLNCLEKDHLSFLSPLKVSSYTVSSSAIKETLIEKEIIVSTKQGKMKSILLANLRKKEDQWKISLIEEAFPDDFIGQTIFRIIRLSIP
jgi:hypothetical protein